MHVNTTTDTGIGIGTTQNHNSQQFDDAKFHLEKWRQYSEKVADCQMSQKFEKKIATRVENMALGE